MSSSENNLHTWLADALKRHGIGADESTIEDDRIQKVLQDVHTHLHALDVERESLRTQLESRHKAHDQHVNSILRALSDGLCTLDREGRCTSLNMVAARYLGAHEEELLGEHLLGRFKLSANHSSSPDVFGLLWTSVRERLALRFEQAILIRADGTELAVSCIFNPLIEHDEVTGCVFVFRDVSASRRSEIELLRLNDALRDTRDQALDASRSKSTFLANMSHELRTPLNAIIGYAELVQEDVLALSDATHIHSDVLKIHMAAEHLLHIINDILDVSKIEAGKMEVYAENFDVYALVQGVLATISGLVEKNDNALDLHIGPGVERMMSDKLKLRQILMNLLSNASKFTQDGTITLRVSRQRDPRGARLIFEVTDTGIGIPEARLATLFDSFTQADQSTTRRYGGTGLGLTITHQFCQMLDGDVTVESVHGEGSTFRVNLPEQFESSMSEVSEVGLQERSLSQEFSQISNMLMGDQRHVVLCIDDDPAVTEIVSRFLPDSEFYVVQASNGAEGIMMAREIMPDVITLDVMMPDADGWSVLAKLKSDDDLASIPVVMLTIVAERQKGYALGATDYLTKPIQRARLVDTLRRHCTSSGTIMVVEDDTETRNILRRIMETRGWEVIEAEHGKQALELLEHSSPDAMLLDLMMPELDGFGVLEQLRKDIRYSQLPVIILTAMDLTVDDMQRLHERTVHIMQKGTSSPTAIANQIRGVIDAKYEEDIFKTRS